MTSERRLIFFASSALNSKGGLRSKENGPDVSLDWAINAVQLPTKRVATGPHQTDHGPSGAENPGNVGLSKRRRPPSSFQVRAPMPASMIDIFLRIVAVVLTALAGALASNPAAAAAGFQEISIPDIVDQPLAVGIWYPSDAPVRQYPLDLYRQEVALDGPVAGARLPLIIMSHGTGESFSAHYDTAMALAAAGFVVAAMTHTGDNHRDRSYSFTSRNFVGRAHHIHQVIDYMLNSWP